MKGLISGLEWHSRGRRFDPVQLHHLNHNHTLMLSRRLYGGFSFLDGSPAHAIPIWPARVRVLTDASPITCSECESRHLRAVQASLASYPPKTHRAISCTWAILKRCWLKTVVSPKVPAPHQTVCGLRAFGRALLPHIVSRHTAPPSNRPRNY